MRLGGPIVRFARGTMFRDSQGQAHMGKELGLVGPHHQSIVDPGQCQRIGRRRERRFRTAPHRFCIGGDASLRWDGIRELKIELNLYISIGYGEQKGCEAFVRTRVRKVF